MAKVYVLVWSTESHDDGIAGYWTRRLTKGEQHAYFAENHPDDYDVEGDCYIHWDLVELEEAAVLPGLPEIEWTDPI